MCSLRGNKQTKASSKEQYFLYLSKIPNSSQIWHVWFHTICLSCLIPKMSVIQIAMSDFILYCLFHLIPKLINVGLDLVLDVEPQLLLSLIFTPLVLITRSFSLLEKLKMLVKLINNTCYSKKCMEEGAYLT